jgi:glutamine synthetase
MENPRDPASRGITYLCWTDLAGMLRCRGVPAWRAGAVMEEGLGWAAAGQVLTAFGLPAENPWGPMSEVRQVPVKETAVRIDIWDDAPALSLVLCNTLDRNGTPWECCARDFLDRAAGDLERLTGLRFMAAFEHEFTLLDTGFDETTAFSLESMRRVAAFCDELEAALTLADVGVETIEPECGRRQYEVSCAPATGVSAGDRAVISREVIREAARRRGYYASFSPKPFLGGIGSGAHIHFSFCDAEGRNVTPDSSDPARLSERSAMFAAGVIKYLPDISALIASSPVSYLRLGPGNWSCGYTSFGIQNREAALRVCPPYGKDAGRNPTSFNLEFRPPDATANPYLALGALIRAGLEGIKEKLPPPYVLDRDPASLTAEERAAHGIRALPASLGEALDLMMSSAIVSGWMSGTMMAAFDAVKRSELRTTREQTPDDICRTYLRLF